MVRKRFLLFTVCVLCALPVLAQTTTPSTEQMVDQLKRPRLRSLRNLAVETAPESPTAEESTRQPAATESAAAPNQPPEQPSLSLLIQFDFNSARVRPESQQALTNLSEALQTEELKTSSFAIEGHTDAKGSAEYNQKLSLLRAQAVRDFLMSRGVAEARLVASGKGASELISTATPFAPENRRVRIVNLD